LHPLVRAPYTAASALARFATHVAPAKESKLFKALTARRDLVARYERWAAAGRDTSRPLLWVHAPSVGEGLQALPVIQRFRDAHPRTQIVYTHFSPSAERFAITVGADFFDYLPFDHNDETGAVLDAIRPTAIVFSKLDVWPNLVDNAVRRGVKLGLLSATVPESSRRQSGLALLALRDAYESLDVVGAISPSDAERLLKMGVRGDRLTITGDTRYDQVWARATSPSASRDSIMMRYQDPRPTLVAGSTWPSDEQRLLPAWMQLKKQ
jgi:3-deoxy-D-manno-octulosonic-acid transferase